MYNRLPYVSQRYFSISALMVLSISHHTIQSFSIISLNHSHDTRFARISLPDHGDCASANASICTAAFWFHSTDSLNSLFRSSKFHSPIASFMRPTNRSSWFCLAGRVTICHSDSKSNFFLISSNHADGSSYLVHIAEKFVSCIYAYLFISSDILLRSISHFRIFVI